MLVVLVVALLLRPL